MLKVLELFAGIGACSKALERLGIEHEIVDAVEIDKYAIKSFNAVHGTNFEPQDITKWDKDIKVDLIMHGSPCQDFSVAGLGAGGDKDSGTRSSLMYETLRIVEKLKPQYVIWENVKNLLSKKHRHNFDAYLDAMEGLGYTNYYQVLNAKDYGVPQNRERVFTISILGGGEFEFPPKQELTVKLRDILEDEVDEKFYLTDEQVASFKASTYNCPKYETIVQDADSIARTLCARDYKGPKCIEVQGRVEAISGHDILKRVYGTDGLAPTLSTMGGGNTEPKVIDPQGRKNKVCVPRDYAPTLRAQTHGNLPQVIEPTIVASRGRGEPPAQHLEPRKDGLTNTITSVEKDNYVAEPSILEDFYKNRPAREYKETSPTLRADRQGLKVQGMRIRKLTPKECWRLMGFDDEDFEKAAKVNSNSQLYKQAGNSIVVNVLEGILGNLLKGEK